MPKELAPEAVVALSGALSVIHHSTDFAELTRAGETILTYAEMIPVWSRIDGLTHWARGKIISRPVGAEPWWATKKLTVGDYTLWRPTKSSIMVIHRPYPSSTPSNYFIKKDSRNSIHVGEVSRKLLLIPKLTRITSQPIIGNQETVCYALAN